MAGVRGIPDLRQGLRVATAHEGRPNKALQVTGDLSLHNLVPGSSAPAPELGVRLHPRQSRRVTVILRENAGDGRSRNER